MRGRLRLHWRGRLGRNVHASRLLLLVLLVICMFSTILPLMLLLPLLQVAVVIIAVVVVMVLEAMPRRRRRRCVRVVKHMITPRALLLSLSLLLLLLLDMLLQRLFDLCNRRMQLGVARRRRQVEYGARRSRDEDFLQVLHLRCKVVRRHMQFEVGRKQKRQFQSIHFMRRRYASHARVVRVREAPIVHELARKCERGREQTM